MYYHSRAIENTIYGKVGPAPASVVDNHFLQAYKWLSKYLPDSYCPQIWLSRSKSSYTGYTNQPKAKQSKLFGKKTNDEPSLLFGFDIIKGFPVDYELWCDFLPNLVNCKDGIKDGDLAVIAALKQYDEWAKEDEAQNNKYKISKAVSLWRRYGNLQSVLNLGLFIEHDQVVVPALNLKSAKVVYCRNESQVKRLLKMGFIHDRVKILNSKFRNF